MKKPNQPQSKPQSTPTHRKRARGDEVTLGKDEMNLAEFPLTTLGTRDNRDVLVYSGWVSEKGMQRYEQQWTVRAASGLGLPGEFGDRVLLALLALTFQQSPLDPRVNFSRYHLLRMLGMASIGLSDYERLEATLKQLVGMTIESRRAFYDKKRDKRIVTTEAFHVFDRLWIRRERKGRGENTEQGDDGEEESQGYIVWSPQFWGNLQGGYIKNIDLRFYYALPTPLARRLYRLLDKRLHHRTTCEMDIFELGARLGQQHYAKPSQAFRKLKPAIDVLIAERFLKSAELVKRDRFTRLRFERWGAGEFGKHQEAQKQREAAKREVEESIGLDQDLAAVWATVLRQLDANLSGTQRALLTASHLLAVEKEHVQVLVPHRFAAERLTAHPNVGKVICAALSAALNQPLTTIAYLDIDEAKGRAE